MSYRIRSSHDLSRCPELGAGLIELAISLPFLMVVLTGLVGYGVALREAQIASTASRHAARAVSSLVAEEIGQFCHRIDCDDPRDTSVECAADREVKSYLERAGLKTSEWTIRSTVHVAPLEGSVRLVLLEVSLAKKLGRPCAICMPGMAPERVAHAVSTFALEGVCR